MKRLLGSALLLLAAAAAVLAWTPGLQTLRDAVGTVPAPVWLAAVAGMLCSYGIRARRLADEWPALRLRTAQALPVVLLHNAAVVTVPLRGGEAAYPLLLHRRLGIASADAVASLVWLRLQDATVLLLLVFVAFAPLGPWPVRALLALLVVVLAVRTVVRWARARGGDPQPEPEPTARWRRAWATARQALRQGGLRAMHRGWLWATCNWLTKAAALGLLLGALLGLPLHDTLPAMLLGEAGGALPLHVPAGFGAYEAGIWLGLQQGHAWLQAAQVLGAGLVVHVFALLVGLLAAAVCLAVDMPQPVAGQPS